MVVKRSSLQVAERGTEHTCVGDEVVEVPRRGAGHRLGILRDACTGGGDTDHAQPWAEVEKHKKRLLLGSLLLHK